MLTICQTVVIAMNENLGNINTLSVIPTLNWLHTGRCKKTESRNDINDINDRKSEMRIRVLLLGVTVWFQISVPWPYFCKKNHFFKPTFPRSFARHPFPKKLSAPPTMKMSLFKMTLGPGMQESGFHGYKVNHAEILISFFFQNNDRANLTFIIKHFIFSVTGSIFRLKQSSDFYH